MALSVPVEVLLRRAMRVGLAPVKMTADAFQDVDGGGQAPKAVPADRSAYNVPKRHALDTMRTRLGKAFGNRLQEDSERLGVDAIDHLAPDEQLANRAATF